MNGSVRGRLSGKRGTWSLLERAVSTSVVATCLAPVFKEYGETQVKGNPVQACTLYVKGMTKKEELEQAKQKRMAHALKH
jgi:hypothetical protein